MGMNLREPPSDAELEQFARDYAGGLPGWELQNDGNFLWLSRALGPVNQNIWFERKMDGYRLLLDLTVRIPILKAIGHPIPWVAMGSAYLGGRIGSRFTYIRRGEHAARWRQAVGEMDQHIAPSISRPLDMAEIARVCAPLERDDVANDLVMMSVLYASLGETGEARRRCIRLQALPFANPAAEAWERAIRRFALELTRAIEAGEEGPFLEGLARNDGQPANPRTAPGSCPQP